MNDEYPEESELQKIKEWGYNDFPGLMEYVKSLWKYADCGDWKEEGRIYIISTGGWSGNEDIIAALQENLMFWTCCAMSWKRGGHYEFEVKTG